jgi:hypothetical protein
MNSQEQLNQLLRILIQVVARAAMPLTTVQEIVGSGKKQVRAFNLCDGTISQIEIAKKIGIDSGNLSRTVTRWVEHGVAFWIGRGKEARLMHVYPIPTSPKTIKR